MGQFFPVHYFGDFILLNRSAAKFYPISKKNLDDFFWKWKKLELFFEKFPKILRFSKFSKFLIFFEIFYRKSYRKFRKNRKSQKISKFRKIFDFFRKIALTFFIFKKKSSRFFLRLGKILLRSDLIKLKRSIWALNMRVY